ncbi:uncharacterized protein [Miscanthus floridulus]|uniref:uncharacterized protein n=1 Tax=Miscanthus floridulus TaxID=154761 RepID=UPI00345A2F05
MNSREADLTQAQYEQVCPSWCDNHRECWTEIVRMWRTDEAYARRADRQGRRAQMRGVSHHQGNQPLPQFATRWTQTHGGQEINEYTAYLLSHKGKATDPNNVYNPEDGPDAYTNPTAYEKATEYTVAAHQRYGETFDPHRRAPGHRPPAEVGTREAARPLLHGPQRPRPVPGSYADPGSIHAHELQRHPRSAPAAVSVTGKCRFVRRSLVSHLYIQSTLRM